jgi:hypothetical protein
MFNRVGALEILAAAYDVNSVNQLKQDWQNIVRDSGSFCQKDSCPFVVEGSFAYDPENFLYYRARAITADIANGNGDLFPLIELEASYPTFVGKGVYLNHDSDNPDKSFGLVLDSVLHKPKNKHAYVEVLAAIDKEIAEEKHPGIIRKLSNGFLNSTSMGCSCANAECGICHNMAYNTAQLCSHMHPDSLSYVKGRRYAGGDAAYEINYGITFTEDSIVGVAADPSARILELYASLTKSATLDQIKASLLELNKLIECLENEKKI